MGMWSQQPEAGERLATLEGSVDLALWGTKCAPWSAAQTVPPERRSKEEERWLALIELRVSLANLLKARPRRVIIETANVTRLAEWWPRFRSVIGDGVTGVVAGRGRDDCGGSESREEFEASSGRRGPRLLFRLHDVCMMCPSCVSRDRLSGTRGATVLSPGTMGLWQGRVTLRGGIRWAAHVR